MDTNLAAAIRVIIEMLFFSILIWRTTIILDRLDQYRKSSERVLQQQEKLATLGRYAATIAHEINNPLTAATNLVYLASLSETTPENRKEYLRSCHSELSRIAHVVRHTLGFYRENASPATINLSELFRDLVFSFRQKLGAKGIDVAVSSPEGAQVTAVRGELIQIISNLLSNAIDAAPDTIGQMRLSATFQGRDAMIIVEDNGPGIPPRPPNTSLNHSFPRKKSSAPVLDCGSHLSWPTKTMPRSGWKAGRERHAFHCTCEPQFLNAMIRWWRRWMLPPRPERDSGHRPAVITATPCQHLH